MQHPEKKPIKDDYFLDTSSAVHVEALLRQHTRTDTHTLTLTDTHTDAHTLSSTHSHTRAHARALSLTHTHLQVGRVDITHKQTTSTHTHNLSHTHTFAGGQGPYRHASCCCVRFRRGFWCRYERGARFCVRGSGVRLGKFLHTDVQRFTMWRIPINSCISVGLLSQMRPMISGSCADRFSQSHLG